MDELDERSSLDMGSPLMPAGARREHHQQRPQTLASTGDDMFGDLVNQRHGTLEAGPNDPLHPAQARLYPRANPFPGPYSPPRPPPRGAARFLAARPPPAAPPPPPPR